MTIRDLFRLSPQDVTRERLYQYFIEKYGLKATMRHGKRIKRILDKIEVGWANYLLPPNQSQDI